VVVDSPLAAKFTDVYRQLKPCRDKEVRRKLHHGRHQLAFDLLWAVNEHLQTVVSK